MSLIVCSAKINYIKRESYLRVKKGQQCCCRSGHSRPCIRLGRLLAGHEDSRRGIADLYV